MQKPTLSTALSIFNANAPLTMTLKEITDLLKVRHNDAMRVVENMAESPDFGQLRKSRTSFRECTKLTTNRRMKSSICPSVNASS